MISKDEIPSCLKFAKEGLRARFTTINDLEYVKEHEKKEHRYVSNWSTEKHQASLHDEDTAHLIVEFNEKPVGYFILNGLTNTVNKSLEFTRIVVSEKGKGYGRQIIRAVKTLTFTHLRYHRLWIDVIAYNTRAFELYKSEGFVLEGKLRENDFFEGEYQSLYILSKSSGRFDNS